MRVVLHVGKLIVIILVVWLLALIFLTGSLHRNNDSEEALAKKLIDAQSETLSYKRELEILKRTISGNADVDPKLSSTLVNEPTREYESYRRRAYRDVQEMWFYIRSKLEALKKDKSQLESKVKEVLSELETREQVVLLDLEKMKETDGHDQWRQTEARDLSDLVQARLKHLQNPEDCSSAKKLVCNLNKGCGYGCQIHHAIYCFLIAYGTERTMVLKSQGWRYNKKGFEEVFLPLSETCNDPNGQSRATWPGSPDTQVLELPIVDSVSPRPPYLPPAVPADLVDRIARLHGDPIVWWVSQFLKYMLRPQPHLRAMLKATEENFKFEHPIVGVHIRRTDKVGTEAAFHSVEEYMTHVLEWFRKQKLTNPEVKVRVYVASDEPRVLGECRKKYPDVEFLGDQDIARSAAVSSRYSDSSLRGVIQDIHLLSLTDHLVCTFSSQVCRIAYEIMQQYHPDASNQFKSLDDIWYYGGQDEHQQEAIFPHEALHHGEIELKVGDVLGVAGNHWDGSNKGRNHRTNKVGLYPEFKTRERLRVVSFPTYDKVEL